MLDELVPRRSAGSGLCRNELDFYNITCSRADLRAAVQSRKMKAGTSATAFSDSAELTNVPGWLDDRIGRSETDLLTDVAVIRQLMDNLGFHANAEDIKTAVYERRARYIDGDD